MRRRQNSPKVSGIARQVIRDERPTISERQAEDNDKDQCNRKLLRAIAEKAPGSLDELARITGKAKSNLSRTLRTMEGYGLVRLERGERGRITPKVMHDRVELDLPLTLSRKAS